MKMKCLCFAALLSIAGAASASRPTHLNIFHTSADGKSRVKSVELSRGAEFTFASKDASGSYSSVLLNGEDALELDRSGAWEFSTNVPLLEITTDPVVKEITSKKDYLEGTLTLTAYGHGDDLAETAVSIRGRGNTTWAYEKKPYRIKFAKKTSLLGLAKAKNYVLIANYLDATLMKNAMALRLAQMLDMPFTNHSIPVNVVLNGDYKGAYMLSEKQGINSGSVDIDESTGILWELDTNYDEDYKFRSPGFNMPVMLSDPDPADVVAPGQTPEEWFAPWQADFIEMETAVKEGRADEVLEMDQIVDYLLVNLLAGNRELSWPKSTKLYKESIDSKYSFGPVWDFDWGFNYVNKPDLVLLAAGSSTNGTNFFTAIARTDAFMSLMAERWAYFKDNLLGQWLDYIDEYAAAVRVSALQNGERWPAAKNNSADFDEQVKLLRQWIIDRVDAIDSHPNYLIFN